MTTILPKSTGRRTSSFDGRFFYGWIVVAAVFAITFVGFGSAYTFSAFVESLQDEFSASRGAVSLVFSLAGFLYFGLGILSGPLADRWGARRLAIIGMLLVGTGLMLASQARTIVEVYAAYGLGIGIGVGCAYVPAVGAVQRWFTRRRGFASGIAVSGIGVGTLAMPPLASWLIGAVGWRDAYLVLGLLAVLVGAGMSCFLVSNPRDRGTGPEGDPLESPPNPGGSAAARSSALAGTSTEASTGASVAEAIRTRQFVGLYAACLLSAFGVFVPFVHLVPYAIDHRIGQSSAVLLLGTIGVGSTAGRFFLGGLADRMGRQLFLVVMYVGMAVSLAIWIAATEFWGLAVFALLFGLFYGGWVAILPAVVMDRFGGRNVSAIIGILYTSVAIGTLIGPSAAGFAFDVRGSYTLPIAASVIANTAAAVIAVFVLKAGAPLRQGERLA
jgi:MFS transporter, OFA family, oxalate/formate antiporter